MNSDFLHGGEGVTAAETHHDLVIVADRGGEPPLVDYYHTYVVLDCSSVQKLCSSSSRAPGVASKAMVLCR